MIISMKVWNFRYAAGRFLSNATEHGKEQQTENHREEHGVNVERPEGVWLCGSTSENVRRSN